MARILSQNELDSLTKKRYGSSEAIAEWSDTLDDLLSEIESLRDHRRAVIIGERSDEMAMDAARRAFKK